MLNNKEIVALIKAIGVGIDDQFDLDNLRYHKIIIMADADADGSHIATLLMTFFFRYMRPVVEAGHIYLSQPPTHALKVGKKVHYVYSDDEYQTRLAQLTKEGTKAPKVSVTRFKGLGEMDDDQLWQTTMDPARRVLIKINIDDAEEADLVFSRLMGGEG